MNENDFEIKKEEFCFLVVGAQWPKFQYVLSRFIQKHNWELQDMSQEKWELSRQMPLSSIRAEIRVLPLESGIQFFYDVYDSEKDNLFFDEEAARGVLSALQLEYQQMTGTVEIEKVAQVASDQLNPSPATNPMSFWSVFRFRKFYYVTPILIIANVGMWLLMCGSGVNPFAPTAEDLIKWGANFTPYTIGGQWWRLLSSAFLHAGVFHLFMNMFAFYFIGILLERLLGWQRYLLAYLCCAACGSVISLWWRELAVGVGASGAIFGMYGLFLGLVTTRLIEKEHRKQLSKSLLYFVVLNLGIGMMGNIDNAAHIGGLLSGFVFAYVILPSLLKEQNRVYFGVSIIGLLLTGLGFVVLFFVLTPKDMHVYFQKMEKIDANQEKEMEISKRMPSDYSPDFLAKLEQIQALNRENVFLTNEILRLKISKEMESQALLKKEFLEVKSIRLQKIPKNPQQNTDELMVEVKYLDKKLDSLRELIEKAQGEEE